MDDDFPVVVLCPPRELGLGACWRGNSSRFTTRYSKPPARVRHPVRGLATLIDSWDGRFLASQDALEVMLFTY